MSRSEDIHFPGGRTGVLLIHGLTGTPNELRTLAHGLHQAGHEVLCVALAGHCASVDDLIGSRVDDWVHSVENAARRLLRTFPTICVGGLSMGALLALRYALDHPEYASGLALFGTTFSYDGWAVPPMARLAFLLPLVTALGMGRRRITMEAFPYGIKNSFLRRQIFEKMQSGDSKLAGLPGNPWPALAQFQRLAREVRRELHRISAPALILHAKEDDVASLRNVELLQRRLAGPVETVLLTDSYHMITIDQQRREVIERTAVFIDRLTRAVPFASATPYARSAQDIAKAPMRS